MEIVATQKYVRMSPTKLRLVVGAVAQIKDPTKMIQYLQFVPKRAAGVLAKTIKTAMANAKNNARQDVGSLRVKEIQIGEGPRLKRGRAGPRGMSSPIIKKTSHIRVVLETKDEEGGKLKAQSEKLKAAA